MTNEEKYVAIMLALGKISKSMEINLQFNGENFEEMLFQFALECRQQVVDSWLYMFEEITGKKPNGASEAAEYLQSVVKVVKLPNKKSSKKTET